MKTILAVWHVGDKGKTETLRELANLLLLQFPECKPVYPIPHDIPAKGDFRFIIEINGRIIGIESKGDPKTGLEKKLFELASEYKCDLIICTTRTKGETVYAVDNLARERNYDTIWTSTYQIMHRDDEKLVNGLKAKHLLELLTRLSLI